MQITQKSILMKLSLNHNEVTDATIGDLWINALHNERMYSNE